MKDPRIMTAEAEVASALAVERTRPGPGAARRAQALARLHRSIAMGEKAAGDPHDGAARVDPQEANPPAPPRDVRPIPRDLGLGSRTWLGLGCFVVGVAAGAGGLAAWQGLRAGHAPAIVAAARGGGSIADALSGVDQAPSGAVAPGTTAPPPDPSASETRAPSGRPSDAARRGDSRASEMGSGAGLSAERSLLDAARTALARGDREAAMEALGQCAQRYPRGTFVEEREALTIKCLWAMGRTGEARPRAARFVQRYPGSLFLSTVSDPTDSNP
jgi:Tetratricopeptide repeat